MSDHKPEVLVEVGVQREYMHPAAPRVVRNAVELVPRVRRLMAFARLAKLPVLSCVDAPRGHDALFDGPNGSPEAHMPPFSLLAGRMVIDSDNCLCVALDLFQRHQQVILTKHHKDPFTNPKLDRLLTEMPARRFVVFGLPLESSLRILVLGLLRRNRRVTLISDACGWWNPDEAAMSQRQLHVKGCEILTVDEYVATRLSRQRNGTNGRTRRSVA